MVIEEVVPQLPQKPERVRAAYGNCASLGKFVGVQAGEFSSHLEKAKSDLRSVDADFSREQWDWAIVKSYYAIHHAMNALLIKERGFYSKDHLCAILALTFFDVLPSGLYSELREIHAKFADFTGFDVMYSLRKIGQYDVRKWKQLSRSDAESVYLLAKKIVPFIEERCYR